MLLANRNARREAYPDALKSIMNIQQANESRAWLSHWSGLNPGATPLHSLPGLARELGIAQLLIKDESQRSPLGSFKAMGAPIALVRLIMRRFPEQNFEPQPLLRGAYAKVLAAFTVISATDGNHGRALAAASHSIGCQCVIVLHANVSLEREQAIAAYGAQIIRIAGNYDESVEYAAERARTQGWEVVSDTSYEGYEEIPRDVMQGYGTLVAEIVECSPPPCTHVFIQGGVGGLAASVISYMWELYGVQRPAFVIVEPEQADCLYQSALAGQPARACGSVDSVMAGLACGETSPLAWQFLHSSADFFVTITDDDAVSAMKQLAAGSQQDVPIESGESAVAGLAALQRIATSPSLMADMGLDACSRVLLINTEGATAPQLYAQLVGESCTSVRARQQAWKSQQNA